MNLRNRFRKFGKGLRNTGRDRERGDGRVGVFNVGSFCFCEPTADASRVTFARKILGSGALATLVFVIVAGLFGPKIVQIGVVGPLTNPADFRAFYCAGDTVARGADPYRIEPLRSCERRMTAKMGLQLFPGIVIPAPLPPYALALFALVSRVPFVNAVCMWFALLLASTIATAIALRKDTGASLAGIVAIVALCAFDAMLLGQPMPIVVVLAIVAARATAHRQMWLAAAALALGMAEPHLILPAFLALALFRSDLRVPLAVCMAVFALPSLAFGGIHAYVEYFGIELPLHAVSEIHSLETQYSLTTFLWTFLGVSDRVALRTGQLDYVATLVLALFVAKRLSDRFENPRLLVYVPTAFTVFGGMYDHLYDFAIVIPAAITLAAASRGGKAIGYWATAIAVCASSILDEVWGEDLARHIGPPHAELAKLGPDRYASEVAQLFQAIHMPHDPHAIAAIVAIKVPALAGVFVLIVLATYDAFARPGTCAQLHGNLRADLVTGTLRA